VERKNDKKYFLTALGKVVMMLKDSRKSLKDYWKLRALDSLEISSYSKLSWEVSQIIDSLIDNQKGYR
jgi:hypothetical protein